MIQEPHRLRSVLDGQVAAEHLDAARDAVAAHPDDAELHAVAAEVALRLGETRLAMTWALHAVESVSTPHTELCWARALHADDQTESAIRALAQAARQHAELRPEADLWAWAQSEVEAFATDGDPEHLIAAAGRGCPVDWASLARLPWLGVVPVATEACINSLRGLEPARQIPVEMGLSTMEVPSAVMTVRRAAPGIRISSGPVGSPDPRKPLRPGLVLWEFNGTKARAAVPAPNAAASDTVAAFVTEAKWGMPGATYALAAPLAEISTSDLIALLVHTCPSPGGPWLKEPSLWERSVQAWCCLALAHQPDGEALLADLAFGVEDWTTETALYALISRAWADPARRREVAGIVQARFEAFLAVRGKRPVTIGTSLARLTFLTPGMPTAIRQRVWDHCTAWADSRTWPGDRPYRPVEPPAPPGRKSFFGWLRRN